MEQDELSSEKIVLRPLRKNDAEAVRDALDDGRVAQMVSRIPHPYPVNAEYEFIDWAESSEEKIFAIALLSSDELVGVISYLPATIAVEAEMEIGYWLNPRYWGRAFTSKAIALLIDKLKSQGISSLCAAVMDDNPASARVLTKNDFTRYGTTECSSIGRGEIVPASTYVLQLS